MKQARTRAKGLVTPSLPQLWLTAMLRAFVELVRNVVSSLRMDPSRLPAECHSDVPPQALPHATTDTQQQEINPVAASDSDRPCSHQGLSSRKREALSRTHVSTCGLADQWFPALRFAAAGMTTKGNAPSGSVPLVRVPREGGDPAIISDLAGS